MKKLSCTYKCIKPISFDWLQNSIRFEWFCFFTKYVPRENLWVCFKSNNKNAKNDSFLIAFKTFNVCQEESQYLLCTILLKHTNINFYKQSTLCHNSVNIIWWVASIFFLDFEAVLGELVKLTDIVHHYPTMCLKNYEASKIQSSIMKIMIITASHVILA